MKNVQGSSWSRDQILWSDFDGIQNKNNERKNM